MAINPAIKKNIALIAALANGDRDEGSPLHPMGISNEDYIEAKKLTKGVVTLPSGLMYKVLRNGTGTESPAANTSCSCHYHGTLVNGTVFDSSVQRGWPATFAPNQVITDHSVTLT